MLTLSLSIFVLEQTNVAKDARLFEVIQQSDGQWQMPSPDSTESRDLIDILDLHLLYNISDWRTVPDDVLRDFCLYKLDYDDHDFWANRLFMTNMKP